MITCQNIDLIRPEYYIVAPSPGVYSFCGLGKMHIFSTPITDVKHDVVEKVGDFPRPINKIMSAKKKIRSGKYAKFSR